MSDGYRQVDAFESGRIDAVGVGDAVIAVGIDDRVIVISEGDRVEIDHGDRVVDIAVADRVFVLSADTLTSYSRDGDRIRRQSAANGHAIAAIAEADLVGVLGPDRLRAVDVASGRDRFDVERARPGGPADDSLLGTPSGFVVATWSFLTRVDMDGEIGFDRDLEAVVRSLGRCDDAIVAALQNDQLVAADLETGRSRWQTECAAAHVAPVGESSVLVTTTDGIRAVDPGGSTSSIAGLSSGNGYATADGALVCAVRDETISIHTYSREQFHFTVATESVGVGETIDIEATNAGERERCVSLAACVDGASLSPSERSTTLEAGETALVNFPVESVRSEGETMVELSVDGATVEEATIDLDDAASGEIDVEADLEAARIEHGVAELAVTVENVGEVSLEDVRLLETNAGTNTLDPSEEWTGTVTRPYEPDRRVSVGLDVARGDRRREYAPTCTLPPAPTVDVERDGDAIRATIASDGPVTVVDRLVIELPGAGRVRTDVTLDRDELLLVVPRFDDGTARIGFESIDVDERVRLPRTGPGTLSRSVGIGGTQSLGSDHDGAGQTDTERSESKRVDNGRERGRVADETEPNRGHDGSEAIQSDSLEATPADRSSTETLDSDGGSTAGFAVGETDSADEPAVVDTGTGDASTASDDGEIREPAIASDTTTEPHITATRRVSDEAVPIGHAVRDRIDIENEGRSAVTVSADIGNSTVDVGRLEAGECVSLERSVAVYSGDETTLSPVSISADGAVRATLSERTITAAADGVAVRATVDPADGSVVVELENRDGQPRRIRGLKVADRTLSLEARLDAGESATVTGTLDSTTELDADALEGSLAIAEDGSERQVDIVATISSVAADPGVNDDPFELAIGSETQVAGEYATVVLAFENDGDRPLSDVAVSASGEPINELFYSEAHREHLPVGDRIEHFVDLESGVTDPSFDATVRYSVADTGREYTVRAAGPSAEDEAAWTDAHRDRWSVERVEDVSAKPDAPSSLSTPFRPN
ncbi:hypothetical protein [Natrinema sp. 74]|uniref:hypothetical protein n=1 Tax=Natrinema sp. 74 TaxID=3384159 RepID=UPI0038D3F691